MQILLLSEAIEKNNKIRDFLQVGGFHVVEREADDIGSLAVMLRTADGIVLQVTHPAKYIMLVETIRGMTQIPIIVVTRDKDEWANIAMYRAGVNDYIDDSCSQGVLAIKIQSNIKHYQYLMRPFGQISIGGLEIDATKRRVYLRGTEIALRQKEFELLLYLAQRENQVISREELYNAIWRDGLGAGYFNTVSVHVKRVRNKIQKDPDAPKYIETVWGAGYRFCLH